MIIADTGYFSEENLTATHEKKLMRTSQTRTSENATSALEQKNTSCSGKR